MIQGKLFETQSSNCPQAAVALKELVRSRRIHAKSELALERAREDYDTAENTGAIEARLVALKDDLAIKIERYEKTSRHLSAATAEARSHLAKKL